MFLGLLFWWKLLKVLLFMFLGLLFWWKLLRCFYLCFKCLEFLYKKIIILITNCPDNLNIYTTKYNLCIFENVRKPCSRDAFVKTMHHNFRKNTTVCFDYLYWNIILLDSLRCINWIDFPINILYFNSWKTKIPLMAFLYFYYSWMVLKFSDNIIYWFVTYRLLRHEFTINT